MTKYQTGVTVSLLAAVIMGTSLAGLASAGPGRGGCAQGGNWPIMDLTPQQQSQLQAHRQANREKMRDQRASMQETGRALREAMQQGADMAAIRELAELQGVQKTAMIMARAEARKGLEQILSEQQLMQLGQYRNASYPKRRGDGPKPHRSW